MPFSVCFFSVCTFIRISVHFCVLLSSDSISSHHVLLLLILNK